MKKSLVTVIGTLGLLAALTSLKASAQMPNMDMSWAVRSQMQLQYQGDMNARRVAMQYYNYMLRLRQMLYRTFAAYRGHAGHAARLHATVAAIDGCLSRVCRRQLKPDLRRGQ